MFVRRALAAAMSGLPIQIYADGRQRRDFTYIDDAIIATIAAGTIYLPNSVINIRAGGTTYLNEVVEHARQITGRAVNIRPTSARSGDVLVTCADPASAHRLLGWTPTTDLLTGMSAQLKWLISNRNGSPLAADSA